MNDLASILNIFGLQEKEVDYYLANLQTGIAYVSNVARNAKLNRSTAYQIMKKLKKEGLIEVSSRNGRLMTSTISPSQLHSKFENALGQLSEKIPEMNAMARTGKRKPVVKVYEGTSGLRDSLNTLLESENTTLYHIGSLKDIIDILGSDYDTKYFIPKRLEANIYYKGLLFSEDVSHHPNREDKKEKRELRFIDEEFKFHANYLICDEKVIIIDIEKPIITAIIESKEVAEAEIQKFNMIWRGVSAEG